MPILSALSVHVMPERVREALDWRCERYSLDREVSVDKDSPGSLDCLTPAGLPQEAMVHSLYCRP